MSLSQLLFKKDNLIDTIEIQVFISESAASASTITKNPVEKGADVTDHIRIEPMTFSTTGVVSDTPVRFLGALPQTLGNSGFRLSTEAWDKLLKLQADKTRFTLQQNLRSYDNIVIASLDTTQDKETSNALIFTCNMEEIIEVGVTEITANQFNEQDVADQTTPTVESGLRDLKEIA